MKRLSAFVLALAVLCWSLPSGAQSYSSSPGTVSATWNVGGPHGVSYPGSAPTAGQVLVATSPTVSTWGALPASTQPGATLVFQPGGAAGPNVFTTWPSLMTAASSVTTTLRVFFDGTFVSNAITIPSGTYAFTQPSVVFEGPSTGGTIGSVAAVNLTVANGATISGVTEYRTLVVINGGTSAVTTLSSSAAISLTAGAAIQGSNTAPFFLCNGGNQPIVLNFGSLGNGTNPAVNVSGSCTLSPSVLNFGLITAGAISGSTGTAPTSNVRVSLGFGGVVDQIGVYVSYSGYQPSVLVYRPGGSVLGTADVFRDWATLFGATLSINGPVKIYFDCSNFSNNCTIPAGTWAFTNSRVDFIGSPQRSAGNTASPTLTFVTGATLSGVDYLQDITVTSTSTAPIITWSSSTKKRLFITDGAIGSQSSVPFVSVTGTGSYEIDVFANTIVGPGGLNPAITTTGSSANATISVYDASFVGAAAISGIGTTVVQVGGPSNVQTPNVPVINVSDSHAFVFRPGGTSFANVYTRWGALYQVAAGTTGAVEIDFDGSANGNAATIPAGTWAFTQPSSVRFVGPINNLPALGGGSLALTVADGAHLSGVNEYNGLLITYNGTSAVTTAATNTSITFNQSQLTDTGTTAFFSVPNATHLWLAADRSVLGNGATAMAALSGTGLVTVVANNTTTIGTNAFSGTLANVNVILNTTSSGINQAGTAVTLNNAAKWEGYDDTIVPSPSLGANVQAAIDALKSRAVVPTPPGSGTTVLTDTTGTLSWSTPSGTSVTGSGLWYSASGALNSSAIALGGVLVPGTFSAGVLPYTLSASGVTAATYGSASTSPQIVVGADGRITSASSLTIAAPLASATGTLPSGALSGTYSGLTGTGALTAGSLGAGFSVNLSLPTFSGTLALARLGAPTGTGFAHITSGGWDGAARAVDVSSADVTGIEGIANGGTGANTLAANSLLLGNGTSAVTGLALGAAQFAIGQTSAAPVAHALSFDLTCTNTGACTVGQLSGASPIVITTATILEWAASVGTPTLTQADAAPGANGGTIVFQGQKGGTGNTNGGPVIVRGGVSQGSGTSGAATLTSGAFESTVQTTAAGALMKVSNGDGIAVQTGHSFGADGTLGYEELVHSGTGALNSQLATVDKWSSHGQIASGGATLTGDSQYALTSGHSVLLKCTAIARVVTAGTGTTIGDTFSREIWTTLKNVGGTVSAVNSSTTIGTFVDTDYNAVVSSVGAHISGTTVGCIVLLSPASGTLGTADTSVFGEAFFN